MIVSEKRGGYPGSGNAADTPPPEKIPSVNPVTQEWVNDLLGAAEVRSIENARREARRTIMSHLHQARRSAKGTH